MLNFLYSVIFSFTLVEFISQVWSFLFKKKKVEEVIEDLMDLSSYPMMLEQSL